MSNPIKDMVQNPHWIYSRYRPTWDFYLESYEGGIEYCNAQLGNGSSSRGGFLDFIKVYINGKLQNFSNVSGHLFPHPKERTEDYENRLKMSYYYNFCAPIIDIYGDHLFKQSIIEEFAEITDTIKQVGDNIDRQGSSIEEFRKSMSDMAQVNGHCFVVIDSPRISGTQIITRAQQIENNAFPYLSLFTPQNVIHWSLDSYGFPYWVLLREPCEANTNPMQFDKAAVHGCQYRLWTRDTWILYDEKFNLIGQGVHNLGLVPIVPVYDKKSKKAKNFLGVSSIADIAFIARDIYNASSELRQILRDQTFAFLAIQGTSSEYSAITVATSKALLYPEGRNSPAYVSPPSDNAQTYFQHIDRQIDKIYRLAKLDGGGLSGKVSNPGSIQDQQSGVSKAWDFNQTNSSLSTKSSFLEDAEMAIWRIFALWEDKNFTGSIQYPNEFSISSLDEDLREAKTEAELSLGITFNLEVRKAIMKKKFPRKPESELEKMAKESEIELRQKQMPSVGQGMADRVSRLLNQRTATGG